MSIFSLRTLQFSVVLGAVALAGCAGPPGPSVPMKPGSDLATARRAVQVCSRQGPQGGRNALTGGYIAGVVFGGLVLGPVIVATNARAIRDDGARAAVDKCLNDNGFQRRDLSFEEVDALNRLDRYQRQLLLDHLVAGGSLAGFRQSQQR